jgi:BioD-like phosphotransacetylase family protein
VIFEKVDYVTEFARRGLKRKGLELLGVIPHQRMLSNPSVHLICEELDAETLNTGPSTDSLIDDVVVGAMGVNNAMPFFKPGVLLITPGDREDIILAAATAQGVDSAHQLAGVVLTGGLRPSENVLRVIRRLPFPVLLAQEDSYAVASRVHDLTVKTRAEDTAKVSLIRDLIARYVDVKKIREATAMRAG